MLLSKKSTLRRAKEMPTIRVVARKANNLEVLTVTKNHLYPVRVL